MTNIFSYNFFLNNNNKERERNFSLKRDIEDDT